MKKKPEGRKSRDTVPLNFKLLITLKLQISYKCLKLNFGAWKEKRFRLLTDSSDQSVLSEGGQGLLTTVFILYTGWVDIGTRTKVPLKFVTYLSKITKINEKVF
jgi:hypothetical protein